MTQLKKRTLISVLLCVFALAVGMFFATYNTTSALMTQNVITARDGITVTVGSAGPAIDNGKTGIKLTNSTAGKKGSVTISDIKGPFNLKYRPYSVDEAGATEPGNDFERLIFDFVNKVDPAESFSVRLEETTSGGVYGIYSPVWYKNMKNENVLFHDAPSHTNAANLTPLINSNVSFRNRTSGGYGDISVISFDPYTMELSHVKGVSKTVMVDFDDPAVMKKNYASYHTIPDMSQYDVVITLSPFSGKTANVMLYELNGESLGAQDIADVAGPSFDTRINTPVGVAGNEYKLDVANYKMYDLIDGYTAFNGSVKVTDPSGVTTEVINGSFVPATAGKYTLKFTGVDSQGNSGETANISFDVIGVYPAADWEFDYEICDELVLNGEVTLPGARFYSTLAGKYDGVIAVKAAVTANGQSLAVIEDASKPFKVSFEGNSTITVAYSAVDYLGKEFVTEPIAISNNGKNLPIPTLNSTYVVGSNLYVEDVEGTVHTVVSPSGKISNYERILVDEVGTWTVTYTYDGGSYVQYVNGVETVASLWNTKLGLTVLDEIGVTAAYSKTYKTGSIMNSSTPYSQAEYKNVINVSDYTKNDILLEWFTVPKVMGSNEFKQLTIYLDDLQDPSKSIRLEHYLYPYFYYEIMATRVFVGDTMVEEYAALYHTTFYGEWTKSGIETSQYNNTPVRISFDYANKDLLLTNDYYTQTVPLDDPNTIGIGKEWTGFTNDELKLTIEFSIITGEANLMVRTIDNLSLTKEVISDNVAPRVNIVYDKANVPSAKVGVKFPLMDAYAVDAVDGIINDVETSVKFLKNGRVYDYPVNADGTIEPQEEGTFRITYKASDLSGNVGSKTVEIQAYNELAPLTIDIADQLSELYPAQISVGEKIIVRPAKGLGGSGSVDVEIYAMDGETKIDIDGVYIRPQGATDNLKVVYKLTDYLSQYTEPTYIEVPIKVEVSSGAVFSSIIVPPAIMANKPFAIPEIVATLYSADGTSENLDVTVKINGDVVTEDIFTPAEAGEITLQYVTDAGSSELYTISVVAPETETIDGETFFTAGYITAFIDLSEGVSIRKEFTTDEEEELKAWDWMIFNVVQDSSMFIVNPQSALNTIATFTVNKETNKIGKINFRYVNVENPEEQILFSVEKNPNSAITTGLVTVNNKATYTLPGDMTTLYNQGISLGFEGNKLVGVGNQTIATIEETIDGAEFNGFTSEKVYMFIEFVDVEAASEFRLISINGHKFSALTDNDYKAPALIMDREIVSAEFGKKFIFPIMRAEDVLDSVVTVSATITSPSGLKVKEFDNIEDLSGYEFIPNEYGAYRVNITCRDSAGKKAEENVIVRVLNTANVEIITQSAVPEIVRKGEKITLPGLVNIPSDAQTFIYLLSPEGNMIVPGKDRVFTASEYGNYKLFYTVTSGSGVVNVETYTIKVR